MAIKIHIDFLKNSVQVKLKQLKKRADNCFNAFGQLAINVKFYEDINSQITEKQKEIGIKLNKSVCENIEKQLREISETDLQMFLS